MWLVEAGVGIIDAQGSEAGGRTGEVSDIPVLAAGGIVNGAQMAAAVALGAAGS